MQACRAICQAEAGTARTIIERAQAPFGLLPARLSADSAFGWAETLAWVAHERAIEPHILGRVDKRDSPNRCLIDSRLPFRGGSGLGRSDGR